MKSSNSKVNTQEDTILDIYRDQIEDISLQAKSVWKDMFLTDWDKKISEQIQRLMYELSSSSASLGFLRIASAARDIDLLLKEAIREDTPSNTVIDSLTKSLDELIQAIEDDKQVEVIEKVNQTSNGKSVKEGRSQRTIFLYTEDPIESKNLSLQIGFFGYTVETFNSKENLLSIINTAPPQAIIIDLDLINNRTLETDEITVLKNTDLQNTPLIFISNSDKLPMRLKAVRSSGEAYFTKPVDIGALVDALDELMVHKASEVYRILIVDDTLVQAKFYSRILENQGMEIKVVTDPMDIMTPLNDFNPDLILLDMYMPECTGMELAKVIRQIESFTSTPIVYLSSETNKNKQLEAMSLGGDDFLAKPIKPEHLTVAITSRVDRYRKLRSLMILDGLTGLLNHTTMKERLSQEVARVARSNDNLVFAMLDLDRFKSVNDTYGHSTGDRVIKSLARLLKQRLRKSDTIGRVGGEEFAIILPNTAENDAFNLLDNLRISFSKVKHRSEEQDFSTTFSCGLALFPKYSTAIELNEAADRALYSAKKQGRNRVNKA